MLTRDSQLFELFCSLFCELAERPGLPAIAVRILSVFSLYSLWDSCGIQVCSILLATWYCHLLIAEPGPQPACTPCSSEYILPLGHESLAPGPPLVLHLCHLVWDSHAGRLLLLAQSVVELVQLRLTVVYTLFRGVIQVHNFNHVLMMNLKSLGRTSSPEIVVLLCLLFR